MQLFLRWILLGLFLFGLIKITAAQNAKTYRDYYRESKAHYDAGDYTAFLHATATADSLRPNHPVLMYNLAAGYALTDQPHKALRILYDRIAFYAAADFTDDEDFTALRNTEGYAVLLQRIDSMNTPRQTASRAFALPEGEWHSEGIAWHAPSGRFLIGDIHSGRIMSYKPDGTDPQLIIDLASRGYGSAMGMRVNINDPNTLWVAIAMLPEFEGYSEEKEGQSAVLRIDISAGEIEHSYKAAGDENHIFGDLVQATDGLVYVSDSGEPTLYTIAPGKDTLELWITDSRWWNLQGMALSEDGEYLYIADYITGIFKIDISTKEVTPLLDANAVTRGSDGIYVKGNRLIFIQNGTTPKRVGKITLDDNGDGIASTITFPDNALDALNEPTLGTFRGDTFYYIANSPWAFYDEERNPVLEDRPAVEVWKW